MFGMISGLKNGIAALWSLLWLSSILSLFLLFDGELLALHRANIGERLRYLQQREALLQQSLIADVDRHCQQAAIAQSAVVTFRLSFTDGKTSSQQQHWLCRKTALFTQLPQQALQSKVADFVTDPAQWQLLQLPLVAADYQQSAVLWLPNNAEWTMENDFYGVVLAQGELRLRGEGKIIGALIHDRGVDVGEHNTVVFAPQVRDRAAERYQHWQYQAGSWHDFNPL